MSWFPAPRRRPTASAEHAELMTAAADTLLSSWRLLLHRASRSPDHRRAAAVRERLDHLGDARDQWSLLTSPDRPLMWIAVWSQVHRRLAEHETEVRGQLGGVDDEDRRHAYRDHLGLVQDMMRASRRRLRRWQIAELNATAPDPPLLPD